VVEKEAKKTKTKTKMVSRMKTKKRKRMTRKTWIMTRSFLETQPM
jgi:hypothetical protein